MKPNNSGNKKCTDWTCSLYVTYDKFIVKYSQKTHKPSLTVLKLPRGRWHHSLKYLYRFIVTKGGRVPIY